MSTSIQEDKLPQPLVFLNIIVGSISVIFLLLSFVSFCFVQNIQKYMSTLIQQLFFSCLFTTIAYMFPYSLFTALHFEKGCTLTAFGMVWFEHSVFLNSLLITISSFLNFKRNDMKNNELSKRINIFYICINYIFPLGIAILTWKLEVLGQSYFSCWINPITDRGHLMNWIFYIYYWLLLTINLIFILIIIKSVLNIYSKKYNLEKDLISKPLKNLLSYPIIQLITVLPMTISKLVNYIDNKNITLVLKEISLLFILVQGILFVAAYCINYNILKEIRRKEIHVEAMSVFNIQYRDNKSDDYSVSENEKYDIEI